MAYAKSELKSSASNTTHLALCMLTAGLRNSPKCDVCILRFLLWPSRFISRNRRTNCAVCIPLYCVGILHVWWRFVTAHASNNTAGANSRGSYNIGGT